MKTYHDIVGDGGSDVVGQVTEQIDRLTARMASVKHKVAVMSGKGGVGKSSVTVNLATALAVEGKKVGIMDADINGSSIPKMLGVRGAALERNALGVLPPKGALDIKVMSIDFFLSNDEQPVTWDSTADHDAYAWRGLMEAGALREMLTDTVWGELDYLFIDVPPGTDKLTNIADVLPQLSGVVMVSIPSGVSQFIVGKSLHVAKNVLEAPVIGLIENMSAYICTSCGKEEVLFPGNDLEALAVAFGIPHLGKIPFDPRMAAAADTGEPFVVKHESLATADAVRQVANRVNNFFEA